MDRGLDRLSPLKKSDLEQIHQKTADILVHTGMSFESEKARDIFRKHGFKVDGDIVCYSEQAIEEAIKKVPKEFKILAKNPKHTMHVTLESMHFHPGGGSPFVTDHQGVRRNATPADVDDFQKMIQHFDDMECTRPIVQPSAGIPAQNAYMYCTYSALKHTDKVMSLFEDGVDMMCIVYGISKEKIRDDARKGVHYGLSVISVTSPLELTVMQSDRLIEQAGQYGTPLVIAPMPAAGTTAPCTIPGFLIQQNCENIGTIVLAQLVNPGNPVFYGVMGSGTDFKIGSAVYGGPETRIMELAGAQIAKFYGMPCRGNGGLTDAHFSDFQAGAEAALHYYNVARGGVNLIPGAGHLGSFLEQSLEQFVLDCEIMGYVKRILRPLEFTEENMAADLIKKVGPKGQYLTEEHTFNHFREEFYDPIVFPRMSYNIWAEQGKKEAREKAHEKVLEILANYQRPEMDPAVERDLDKYVAEHWPVK
ncbi:trimethylamine methyltransferase family protein [Candidatus Formimonas warabiya]|uniref:Trimethylamine methyltransferase n=1 Tax=Formimonas warabiya TaxID=1761012 RepID=A0A3G1KWH0_FORW1|nr:trimethylamine methyltransferase family protein [Candidatus Formimonas warabiya]ATW26781.1 hypothetical protein DCMF_20225 [Candidatus Formimonas warabiya]